MVSDNPASFSDLDGHQGQVSFPNFGSLIEASWGNPDQVYVRFCAENPGSCPAQQPKPHVQETVTEQPKVVQNEKQADGPKTGVRGQIQDTITVNGEPVSGVTVTEANVDTTTLNGQSQNPAVREGSGKTNDAGQVDDLVGLLAPARTAEQDKGLIKLLNTQAVTVTNTNTIFFSLPSGAKYSATSTRILTNVGSDGKVMSQYTLTVSPPVVKPVPQ
jgi:hypothetical protein